MRVGISGNKKYLYITIREIIDFTKDLTSQIKKIKNRKNIESLTESFFYRAGIDKFADEKTFLITELKRVLTPVLSLITLDETYKKTMTAYQKLRPIVEIAARTSGAWTAPGNIAEIAEISFGIATQKLIEVALSLYVELKDKALNYEIRIPIATIATQNKIDEDTEKITSNASTISAAGDKSVFSSLISLEPDESLFTNVQFDKNENNFCFILDYNDQQQLAGSETTSGIFYNTGLEWEKQNVLENSLYNKEKQFTEITMRPVDFNEDYICIGTKNEGIFYSEKQDSLENLNWKVSQINKTPLQFFGTELNNLKDKQSISKEAYVGDIYINEISYDMWRCVESYNEADGKSVWAWEKRLISNQDSSNILRTLSIDNNFGFDGNLSTETINVFSNNVDGNEISKEIVFNTISSEDEYLPVEIEENKIYRILCVFKGIIGINGTDYNSNDEWKILCLYTKDAEFTDNGLYSSLLVKTEAIDNLNLDNNFYIKINKGTSIYELRVDDLQEDYIFLSEIFDENRIRFRLKEKTYYSENDIITLEDSSREIYKNGTNVLYDVCKTYNSPYGSQLLKNTEGTIDLEEDFINKDLNKYLTAFNQDVKLVNGKYILSFWYKGDSDVSLICNNETKIFSKTEEWKKAEFAFEITEEEKIITVDISTESCKIAGIKLEFSEDEISTPWTLHETEKTRNLVDFNFGDIAFIRYVNDNLDKSGCFVAVTKNVTNEQSTVDVYYTTDVKYWSKSFIEKDVENTVYKKLK